jgi:hypothetical protein
MPATPFSYVFLSYSEAVQSQIYPVGADPRPPVQYRGQCLATYAQGFGCPRNTQPEGFEA